MPGPSAIVSHNLPPVLHVGSMRAAAKALYAVMTPEQVRKAEQVLPLCCKAGAFVFMLIKDDAAMLSK